MNFSFKLKNIAGLALIAVTIFNLSSCKNDDNEVTPVILLDSKATVKTSTIPVGSKDTKFFDLVKNVVTEKAETSTITLSGMSGSSLKPSTTAYKFGYFDLTGKTVEDIKVADLKGLAFKETTSLGLDASVMGVHSSVPTWVVYAGPPTHLISPVANRFILLYKGSELNENADDVIIFKIDQLTQVSSDATYTLKVKHFVK